MCFTSRARIVAAPSMDRWVASLVCQTFASEPPSSGADPGGTASPDFLATRCRRNFRKCPEFFALEWRTIAAFCFEISRATNAESFPDLQRRSICPIFSQRLASIRSWVRPWSPLLVETERLVDRPCVPPRPHCWPGAAKTGSFAVFHGRISADLCALSVYTSANDCDWMTTAGGLRLMQTSRRLRENWACYYSSYVFIMMTRPTRCDSFCPIHTACTTLYSTAQLRFIFSCL